ENTLIVGETGEIEASIRSKTVAVSGSVTGDIMAATKVVLHKTARVSGNITTGSLVVEDGAEIDGQIKMGKSAGLKAVEGGAPRAAAAESPWRRDPGRVLAAVPGGEPPSSTSLAFGSLRAGPAGSLPALVGIGGMPLRRSRRTRTRGRGRR